MKLIYITIFTFATSFVYSATDAEEETRKWRDSQTPINPTQTHEETHKEPNKSENVAQPEQKDKEKPTISSQEENATSSEKKQKEPEPSKLVKKGNLAFPTSQQPTPLIAFGQNLIGEGIVDWQEVITYSKQKNGYFIDAANSIIYGFKDNVSIFINEPIAIRFRQDHHRSTGPEDLIIQLEYAPYTQEYLTYYNQLSIVANVTIPTGSPTKNPPTGTGANSFFIGGTFSKLGVDWFYFTSYGAILNATSHKTTFGNQFLYQYGIGRRIFSNADWLFDWMLEFSGQYTGKNKIKGVTDPNSGGNIIYITPSLFLASSKHLVIQLGIGFPIVQQLFGHQPRKEFLLQTKISWAF